MGANMLEPTNIVIARCSLFRFLERQCLSLWKSASVSRCTTEERGAPRLKSVFSERHDPKNQITYTADGGNVFSWGMGQEGQLGLGEDRNHVSSPCLLSYSRLAKVTQIRAGDNYGAAVTAGGELFLWG
ncbi:hypothetical protein JOB18_038791 [Solea senegalensis]|uniref:Uncharacterized protein n=1 Tax=Solea senegalensis TaxID=28829 RepID=A0AAV6QHH4_SOLSE|nr:hypothetical protein JOB18_038791 [Solea senegalensis]